MDDLTFLGKAGSLNKDCPTVYATDHETFVIQGWQTDEPDTVEIPHVLLGFIEQGSYVGAVLTDTGRGTFTLSGRVIADPETLGRLKLAEDEMAIEVPALERTFFGAAAAR
ncbi:hypothetical protein [Nocardia wallacei]|uniref:hypothetical protein n=1 Tax=Nocardia wallacei TaxID=480035 RepID=UPI0024547886|nr:hypothetical protein [Nocardia wallacei]